MSRKHNRIIDMDDSQVLNKILALADIEIEYGETVPAEEIMKEFGVIADGRRVIASRLATRLPSS
jgi:hypothetical protein